MTERIGIFGGSFDPIHNGHIVVATQAHAQLNCDRVLLVVAGDPWQKAGRVEASAADRLAMATLAVEGLAGIEVCDLEVNREGPSYTIDTIEALEAPGRTLLLILGEDALRGLDAWHRSAELRDKVELVGVARAGRRPRGVEEAVEIPRLDIASTDLRLAAHVGEPIDGYVPPSTARYIREHGLYGASR